jgi:ATPase family associated with various cellular activities (AAA)
MVGDSEKLEELIESDHVDDIEAVCLLAPAMLHADHVRPYASRFQKGMPVLDFFCRRFFSVCRRSLVPCGGLDGRVARGKSHSKYIREDAVLRELLGGESRESKTNHGELTKVVEEPVSREDAFLKVIQKLSLTDASKESSESVMVGRDNEQKAILSFLKSSIRGEAEERGSMFVAGPPGVGKTACIRAAIAKLQRAQSAGLVPAFRFIALNGMEMRHPFEAYVRLLEALKGGTKVRKSEEEAAAALERYFTTPVSEKSQEDNVVTVVLLDEIDYLVTQKQSVMYNFFDWPRRSAALCNSGIRGRRLVVIGVSNTLNLPERLQPRVQSRIGQKRCFFQSYIAIEIQSILEAKIKQASPVRQCRTRLKAFALMD